MYSLTAIWTIQKGKEKPAITALKHLAQDVEQKESGTLLYLVHVPDMTQPSLPTPSNLEVQFFEVYRNEQAFKEHLNGSVFQNFVKKYGSLFLPTAPIDCGDGHTVTTQFVLVKFLERKAGFIRPEISEKKR